MCVCVQVEVAEVKSADTATRWPTTTAGSSSLSSSVPFLSAVCRARKRPRPAPSDGRERLCSRAVTWLIALASRLTAGRRAAARRVTHRLACRRRRRHLLRRACRWRRPPVSRWPTAGAAATRDRRGHRAQRRSPRWTPRPQPAAWRVTVTAARLRCAAMRRRCRLAPASTRRPTLRPAATPRRARPSASTRGCCADGRRKSRCSAAGRLAPPWARTSRGRGTRCSCSRGGPRSRRPSRRRTATRPRSPRTRCRLT